MAGASSPRRNRRRRGDGPGRDGRAAPRDPGPVATGAAGARDDRPGPGDRGDRAAARGPAGDPPVPHRRLGPSRAAGDHRTGGVRAAAAARDGLARVRWAMPGGCRHSACGRSWSAASGPRSCTRWRPCRGSSCWRASACARSSPSSRSRPLLDMGPTARADAGHDAPRARARSPRPRWRSPCSPPAT